MAIIINTNTQNRQTGSERDNHIKTQVIFIYSVFQTVLELRMNLGLESELYKLMVLCIMRCLEAEVVSLL